jgi:hypothetical protein
MITEPPSARAAHYREMAQETRALAWKCDDPLIKAAYLDLAAKWVRLAEAAERRSKIH